MEKIHPDGSAKTNPIKPNQSRSEFTPKESQRNMQQRKNPPQLKRLDKRNVLSALKLRNEAEGTRTLNLRIDSPNLRFVSACGKDVYDCKIKTYETNGKPK